MIRLCCAVGTWQLVTLVAALSQQGEAGAHEDILLVYETHGVSQEFQQAMQRMADAAWPWRRVVSLHGLLDDRLRYSDAGFAALLADLRARIGLEAGAPAEIWTCWVSRPAEKKLFEAFPTARIRVYEDGLISYLPLAPSRNLVPPDGRPLWRRLRHALQGWRVRRSPAYRLRRSSFSVDPAHLARVDALHWILAGEIAPAGALAGRPLRPVPYAALGAVVARLSAALVPPDLVAARDGPPAVLVLGQALARNGVLSRAEELAVYRDLVNAVLARGYRVLWKEHPRVSAPSFDELAAGLATPPARGRFALLELPRVLPVELVADRLGLAACVAGTTAALFYLRGLHGVAGYSLAPALMAAFAAHGKHDDARMGAMVAAAFPTLDALPPARG